MSQHYDLVVLGAGLGGMAGAIRAHQLGMSTVILEKSDQLGGCGRALLRIPMVCR